tara:strand:+ start:538 stop:792 length:255 start_codon:yes stop_codon:yes gene_type:complete
MNNPKIVFQYTSPTKGRIIEEFNFRDFTQTIRIISTKGHDYEKKIYEHHDAITTAYYITELLRELAKRDIAYVQSNGIIDYSKF